MTAETTSPISPAVDAVEVRQAVEKILHSKYFVNADKKKKFLSLISDFYLEHRGHELNEYVLAYDVFGRDNSYNPSADPIVRVVAHDIRKKLAAYYQSDGANDPVRLEIPAGGYQPIFKRQSLANAAASSVESTPPVSPPAVSPLPSTPAQQRSWPRFAPEVLGLSLAAVCLAVALIVLAIAYRELRQKVGEPAGARNPGAYGPVWLPFLKDPTPPLVILSNPPVLRFLNPSDPLAVVEDSIPLSPEAAEKLKERFVLNPEVSVKERGGPGDTDTEPLAGPLTVKRGQVPRLVLSTNVYTGMGEAIGLHYLTGFFRNANQSMTLKQSRTLSAEDLKNHNVIMLGGVWVNAWSGKLSKTEDMVFTAKATIENHNPLPGEEREYIPQFDSKTGNLVVDYALVTAKPNISDGNFVMLLAGVYSQGTEAAAEYVTNTNYLDQLNQRLRQRNGAGGAYPYFQALLKVGVENGIPTTIALLAVHELRIPEG